MEVTGEPDRYKKSKLDVKMSPLSYTNIQMCTMLRSFKKITLNRLFSVGSVFEISAPKWGSTADSFAFSIVSSCWYFPCFVSVSLRSSMEIVASTNQGY